MQERPMTNDLRHEVFLPRDQGLSLLAMLARLQAGTGLIESNLGGHVVVDRQRIGSHLIGWEDCFLLACSYVYTIRIRPKREEEKRINLLCLQAFLRFLANKKGLPEEAFNVIQVYAMSKKEFLLRP